MEIQRDRGAAGGDIGWGGGGTTCTNRSYHWGYTGPPYQIWQKLNNTPIVAAWDQKKPGRNCHDRDWREKHKSYCYYEQIHHVVFMFSLQKRKS